MAVLEVRHLVKIFGGTRAVDDLSFSVEAGEILVIVGGSGCGKTTTLRCIAGLEEPTGGTIHLEGRLIASKDVVVPPEDRGIGMVFQSYALWPHMTVFQNVSYGLTVKRMPAPDMREAVRKILALVGLEGFEGRYPATLSGGQQQRVALARAAITEPKLLLLDEPLSNLDAKLREQMRDDLRQMVKTLKMTAVHITHDQAEAMALADRMICMRDGRVEQIGTGRELYRHPANRFVADFIGTGAFLEGTIAKRHDAERVLVEVNANLKLWAAAPGAGPGLGKVVLTIRPETVVLSDVPSDGDNALKGTILNETFLGNRSEYLIDVEGARLKAHSTVDLAVGSTCFLSIDPRHIACLPPA